MKSWGLAVGVAVLAATLASSGEASPEPRAGMALWDTGRSSDHPLTAAALAERSGWTQIGSGRSTASFQGDAVVSNGRILAVFRKQSPAVEVHSGGEGGLLRFRCILQGQEGSAARLARVALVEN